jgi:hypothetical protein
MPNGVKEQVREMVDHLPDNCTLEEVMYRLYVLQKIQRGEDAVRKGQVTPHRQVMKEAREWLSKLPGPRKRAKT